HGLAELLAPKQEALEVAGAVDARAPELHEVAVRANGVGDGEGRIERGPVLLEERDLQPVGAPDLARRRRLRAREHAQERRLAAAVRAEQPEARARPDQEIEAVENDSTAFGPLRVAHGDAARLDEAARLAAARLEVEIDGPRAVARLQLGDLVGQRTRALD